MAEAEYPFLERDEAQGMSDPHVIVMRNRAGDATGYKLYQPHAHLRITPRICEDGEFVKDKYASRELNKHETAMGWRYDWPKLQNAYLEKAGAEVRVTSTSQEEDEFPTVPRLGTSENAQTRAIDERSHALDEAARARHEEAKQTEEIDREFREQHNQTMRQAFTDTHAPEEETADGASVAEAREEKRLAAWWRNMSQRFNTWRFDFQEKAAEWREHFSNQDGRLRGLLGWHHQPEQEETMVEPQNWDHPPPTEEQEPDR